MSPQFVDFNADGHLDIVAGIFDGSPHLSRGSAAGFLPPEQILDKDGQRIVLNQFWNFAAEQWETTTRCDLPGASGKGHLTSALAFDWEGDGDFDLLLGDHKSGRVFRRVNEGTNAKPVFLTKNEPVLADGRAIDVPGTVATLRLVDWNRDGRPDLLASSMGDAYGEQSGGGVYLFLNGGSEKTPLYAAPLTLVEASPKGQAAPTRPDSGLYADIADHDGDGDMDLLVGAYSHWSIRPPVLTSEQKQRVKEIKAEQKAIEEGFDAIFDAIGKATAGLDQKAARKKSAELRAEKVEELKALTTRRHAASQKLAPFDPTPRRESFVWLYENLAASPVR